MSNQARRIQKLNQGYLLFLAELKFRFKHYPKFTSEFIKAPKETQNELLRVHKMFLDNHFIAYFVLMKRIEFPKVSVIQDETNGYKAIYRRIRPLVELKSTVTEIDPYIANIFLDQFGSSFNKACNRGALTVLYIMRGVYGDQSVREYLERRYHEAPKSSLSEMVSVIPHWNEVKDDPIYWTIPLFRETIAEYLEDVV